MRNPVDPPVVRTRYGFTMGAVLRKYIAFRSIMVASPVLAVTLAVPPLFNLDYDPPATEGCQRLAARAASDLSRRRGRRDFHSRLDHSGMPVALGRSAACGVAPRAGSVAFC